MAVGEERAEFQKDDCSCSSSIQCSPHSLEISLGDLIAVSSTIDEIPQLVFRNLAILALVNFVELILEHLGAETE